MGSWDLHERAGQVAGLATIAEQEGCDGEWSYRIEGRKQSAKLQP